MLETDRMLQASYQITSTYRGTLYWRPWSSSKVLLCCKIRTSSVDVLDDDVVAPKKPGSSDVSLPPITDGQLS